MFSFNFNSPSRRTIQDGDKKPYSRLMVARLQRILMWLDLERRSVVPLSDPSDFQCIFDVVPREKEVHRDLITGPIIFITQPHFCTWLGFYRGDHNASSPAGEGNVQPGPSTGSESEIWCDLMKQAVSALFRFLLHYVKKELVDAPTLIAV